MTVVMALMTWLIFRPNQVWLNRYKGWSRFHDLAHATIQERLNTPEERIRTVTWLIPVGVAFVVGAVPVLRDFLPELVGISFGVIVIDELALRRQRIEFKRSAVLQMASLSNDFALDAVRIIIHNRWHTDGSLAGINLLHANLEGAYLPWANMAGACLNHANLKRAHLHQVNLVGAMLLEAQLAGAHMRWARLTDALLIGADLEGAELGNADLTNADLSEAKLQNANLNRDLLEGTDLRGADLTGASLAEASFVNANLRWAILDNALLIGTDFSGADSRGARFTGAVYNASTQWHNDEVPTGAIRWEDLDPAQRQQLSRPSLR